MEAMERNVIACLNDVPLLQIQQYVFISNYKNLVSLLPSYANRSARFISAYSQGLTGSMAAWANQKYHGHQTLPPSWAAQAKEACL